MHLIAKDSNRHVLVALVTIATTGLLLAGCTSQSNPATSTTNSTTQPATGAVKADQKVGDTTLSGTITQAGDQYLLSIPGQPAKGIDSYKVKLSEYVGKSVKVTGQYSGDTLFVSKIE